MGTAPRRPAPTTDGGRDALTAQTRFDMQALLIADIVLFALFLLCYAYQVVIYTPVSLLAKKRPHGQTKLHKLAILVAARNEEAVIGQLLDSLEKQDYPRDLFEVFVVADNCSDRTAEIAERYGATVFVRNSTEQVGKGYALDFLLTCIDGARGKDAFDAFVVFDADNLAKASFLTEINRTFSDGYEIVTGFRNSKNYGDSWIAAATGMWFLRVCSTLNRARSACGVSAELQGTGFLFSNKVKEENGGWPFHLLTEDTEFLVHSILAGYTVGYCHEAEFYDEQPTTFRESWRQRLRWAKGGIQVFKKYYGALVRGIFSKRFKSCYDFAMCMAPAYILSVIGVAVNAAGLVAACIMGEGREAALLILAILGGLYVLLTLACAIVTFAEWRRIRASTWKKLLYIFTFTPFMFTYIPVAICAMFMNVSWLPTEHKRRESIDDLHEGT